MIYECGFSELIERQRLSYPNGHVRRYELIRDIQKFSDYLSQILTIILLVTLILPRLASIEDVDSRKRRGKSATILATRQEHPNSIPRGQVGHFPIMSSIWVTVKKVLET